MQRLRVVTMSLAALVAVGSATAQEEGAWGTPESHAREGRAFGVSLSLGVGRMGVGGSGRSSFVAGVVARVGLDSRNRYQLIGELHPVEVTSPVADESFRSANLLLGYGIGQRFKVRPVVGVQFRSWSGSQRVTASDWGPLLGLDVGPELRLSETVSLAPELVFRWSLIEFEGSVGSSFVGAQCVVSWRRGR